MHVYKKKSCYEGQQLQHTTCHIRSRVASNIQYDIRNQPSRYIDYSQRARRDYHVTTAKDTMMRTLYCRTDRNDWNRAIDFEVQKIMGGDDLDEGPPAIIFQPFNLENEAYDSKIAPIVVWGPWADQYEHRVQRGIEQVGWHGRCRLCRAWLVIEEFCPCNMYQHDHCQSVFLRPIQGTTTATAPASESASSAISFCHAIQSLP